MKALTKPNENGALLPALSKDQVELIKKTVAKGTTDDELKLFLYTAQRTGLDPLLGQIHSVKRWSTRDHGEVMSIQTGIDGYRLIAERTGRYAPGREPTYEERNGKLFSATAYVKKLAGDEWHEVAATAFFDEYVQLTKDGKPNRMWGKMPRVMLAKCAEALALRKAFPAEMSGLYTQEEMGQADNDMETVNSAPAPAAAKQAAPTSEPPAETETEVDVINGSVAEVKAFTSGKFEIVDVEGVVYTTKNAALAKKAKDMKGKPAMLQSMVSGANRELVSLEAVGQ